MNDTKVIPMVNQNERLLQLGFRTAAELKHKIIVDWMNRVGSRVISQVFDWAMIEQPALYNSIDEKYRSKLQLDLDELTYTDSFR